MRCYIKGGVLNLDPGRRNLFAVKMSDFFVGSRLDRDLVAGGKREINGRERSRNIKRYLILTGHHRDHVRADLVRYVAVGGYPIGADDHAVERIGQVMASATEQRRLQQHLLDTTAQFSSARFMQRIRDIVEQFEA